MRHLTGTLLAITASTMLTGCLATQSQLKHSSDVNGQQLAAANAANATALNSEKSERAASDSALGQQLGIIRGDVTQLRNDLQSMRTEFGAKITAMEDGLHFAFPVNFDYDQSQVRTQDQAALTRFSSVVQKYYPGAKVTVEGFADPAGTKSYNMALSKKRATAVKEYLVSNGLSTNEIGVVGYGATRQVAQGAKKDMAGAELNRRVVFVIESKGQSSSVAMATPEQQP